MDSRDALRIASQAAGNGMKIKYGIFAGIVFIVFLLFIGILGVISGGAESDMANSCQEDTGEPQYNPDLVLQPNPGKLQFTQIRNAEIIDKVAVERNLPWRATLIALMTSLVESSLHNLNYGDRDSVGLFQQRPSANWGPRKKLVNPKYAANAFFGGRKGRPKGLVDFKGWEKKPLGDMAQKVQVSAFPHRYARMKDEAIRIASKADINTSRGGDVSGEGMVNEVGDQDISTGEKANNCSRDGGPAKGDGKSGKPFHDSKSDWPKKVKNPRSTTEAIKWARKQRTDGTTGWDGKCLNFVARTYGWQASGATSKNHAWALEHYKNSIPDSWKHDKDRHPVPGALMYWDTGSKFGHVALYVGHGKVASTDIKRQGMVDIVDARTIERKWNAKYVGWAPPYFPNGA